MSLIREATVADAPVIATLPEALGYPGTKDFIHDKILQLTCHPDEHLLVCAEEQTVIGFISLHFIPQLALRGDFCRISYFCVDSQQRGKGTGKLLKKYAARLAKEKGCDRLEVHCHSRRTDAHRFYSRQGYTESQKYFVKTLSRN